MTIRPPFAFVLMIGGLAAIGIPINLFLPFHSAAVELIPRILMIAVLPLGFGIGSLVVNFSNPPLKSWSYNEKIVCAAVLAGAVLPFLMTGVIRLSRAKTMSLEVHGIVVRKYQDVRNHNYPMLEIRTDQGEILTFGPLGPGPWSALKEGARIDKDGWSPTAQVEGNRVDLFEK